MFLQPQGKIRRPGSGAQQQKMDLDPGGVLDRRIAMASPVGQGSSEPDRDAARFYRMVSPVTPDLIIRERARSPRGSTQQAKPQQAKPQQAKPQQAKPSYSTERPTGVKHGAEPPSTGRAGVRGGNALGAHQEQGRRRARTSEWPLVADISLPSLEPSRDTCGLRTIRR